jgi:hypothetical protein
MNAGAVLTMVLTMAAVSTICGYFFIKILRTPPKSDDKQE